MKTSINYLLRAAFSLLVTLGFAHNAAAQLKGISLPPGAQEIEPNVYYLGRVKDHAGRDVDGIAFVHPKTAQVKAAAGGAREPKPDPCYAFLFSGVRWKKIEDFVISPSVANAPDGAQFLDQIAVAMDNWEAAAGKPIFGLGAVGDVDLAKIGSIPNGVNEVTFAPVESPSTLAFAVIWGVFSGPPPHRELTEWDVVFRDDVSFGANGEPDKYDFWSTFAHESGHAAGLAHPSDTCTEETMYRFASFGQTRKRTLNVGDIAGIAALYK